MQRAKHEVGVLDELVVTLVESIRDGESLKQPMYVQPAGAELARGVITDGDTFGEERNVNRLKDVG